MTQHDLPAHEERLASALRSALAARDAALPARSFERSWASSAASRTSSRWRPAFAAVSLAAVISALSWTVLGPRSEPTSTALDPTLARELSSEGFWRVPTDELLAHADPAAGIVLPSPRDLEFSLEESLL
ncbi:MAG TPA: hypothetical protein VFR59_11780 [Steroidobacteraceae bacterium]|nr:hypothetical protein [Steroidobacteraceae bacterium]